MSVADGNSSSIDPVSEAIIESLRTDGRKPYAAIAKEVGLAEATVRQRVQRLIDQGDMQVVAMTNPVANGRYTSMLLIRTTGPLDPVCEALNAINEVTFVAAVFGAYNLIVEVSCRDAEHMLRVINDHIEGAVGVVEVVTLPYAKLMKSSLRGIWGT